MAKSKLDSILTKYAKEIANLERHFVSTSIPSLDYALGGKGLPSGGLIEIFGPEDVGKTALVNRIASSQERGVVIIESEMKLSERRLDMYKEKPIVLHPVEGAPKCFEAQAEIFEASDKYGVLIIDTIGAIVSEKEATVTKDMGIRQPGIQSRLVTDLVEQNLARWRRLNTLVLCVNQTRSTISRRGSGETTPGGRALKYFSMVRLNMLRTGMIREKKEIVGHEGRLRIIKNEYHPPWASIDFTFSYKDGSIDDSSGLLTVLIELGIIAQRRAYFFFEYGLPTERKFYGRMETMGFIKDNAEMLIDRIAEASLSPTPVDDIVVDGVDGMPEVNDPDRTTVEL